MNHLFINKTVPNNNIKTLYTLNLVHLTMSNFKLDCSTILYTVTKYFNLIHIVLTTAVFVH